MIKMEIRDRLLTLEIYLKTHSSNSSSSTEIKNYLKISLIYLKISNLDYFRVLCALIITYKQSHN